MNPGQPVIYVVDDDVDSRESVRALIRQMSLQVEAFESAEEFLKAYRGHRPACLLTDHRMLGMTGVDLLENLRKNGISLACIVMTAFAETPLTVRAVKSGAVTVLEKPFSNSALWNAIHEALAEDRSKAQDETRIERLRRKLSLLTESETEVMNLIVSGLTNKVIAQQLGVSLRTVEGRRSAVFEKMEVESVAELVQLVLLVRKAK